MKPTSLAPPAASGMLFNNTPSIVGEFSVIGLNQYVYLVPNEESGHVISKRMSFAFQLLRLELEV